MKKVTKYYHNGEEIKFGDTITFIDDTTPAGGCPAKKCRISTTYDFNKKTAHYLISENKVQVKTFFDIPDRWEEYVMKYVNDIYDSRIIYNEAAVKLLVGHPIVLTSAVLTELAEIMWEDTKDTIIPICYVVSPVDGKITELKNIDITKNINFLFATKEEAKFASNVIKPIFDSVNE